MNNSEKSPGGPSERLKGGSVFSFLKEPKGSGSGVPLTKPEPLTRPEPVRQPREVLELKNRLEQLEARTKRLEADSVKASSTPLQNAAPEFLVAIERRLKDLESKLAAASENPVPAPDLEEKLRRLLENSTGAIRILLEDYRRSGEEKTAEIAGLVEKLGQAAEHDRQSNCSGAAELGRRLRALEVDREAVLEQFAAALKRALNEKDNTLTGLLEKEKERRETAEAKVVWRLDKIEKETMGINAVMDKYQLELSAVKQNAGGTADRAYREAHERLEALVVKLQGDIMTAASDKFSSLRLKWEAAAVEIHNAQKTAYCALEKCEKLDKSLSFLDIRTGALERKCSR